LNSFSAFGGGEISIQLFLRLTTFPFADATGFVKGDVSDDTHLA